MQFPIRLYSLFLLIILLLLAACRPADPGAQPTATSAPATATDPAPPQSSPTSEPSPTAEPAATVAATPTMEASEPLPDLEALRADLASRLEIAPDAVSVLSAEPLPSPDLCLGIYDGSACYRVVLQANGTPYSFHINNAGDFTGVVETVPAGPGEIILTYGRDDCQVAALRQGTPQAGLGPCASEFTTYNLGADAATVDAELQQILSAYAPFNAVTSSGFLSVGGNGAGDPDPQELEDIAAWIRRVVSDAVAQGPSDDALCSRLARPALVTQSRGLLSIVDPFSGEQCELTLPGEFRGAMQAAGGFLYFQDVDGGDVLIREMSPDGTLRPLEVTRLNGAENSLLGWVISPDGQTIAWSTAELSGQPNMVSSLHVASTNGDTAQTLIADLSRDDGRGLIPVRFDDDGQTLAYTLQPIGVGGTWSSFVGRYDSVFTVPVAGGETLQAFDCPDLGLFLCIGDFQLRDGALHAIAYVSGNTVEIVDGQGGSLASITVDAEYVAYPMFSPEDELVFYTATVGEGEGGFPFAMPGAYYRVAPPYDGQPALIAQQDGLLTPYQWFDAQHLIIGVGDATGNWGTALLGLDGSITRLEPWPDTGAVTVIR